jgi:hypothetical protein
VAATRARPVSEYPIVTTAGHPARAPWEMTGPPLLSARTSTARRKTLPFCQRHWPAWLSGHAPKFVRGQVQAVGS